MTRTYVECPVSPATHAEIIAVLVASGYAHVIDDETIYMDGLALVVDAAAAPDAGDMTESCSGCSGSGAVVVREFPAMTPELAAILGTMCFQTIDLARILRSDGQTIKTRAEDEQAAVLHWMLSLWFKNGEDWRQAAVQEVTRIKDATLLATSSKGVES